MDNHEDRRRLPPLDGSLPHQQQGDGLPVNSNSSTTSSNPPPFTAPASRAAFMCDDDDDEAEDLHQPVQPQFRSVAMVDRLPAASFGKHVDLEKESRATSATTTFRDVSAGSVFSHLSGQVAEPQPSPHLPSWWQVHKLCRLGYYHPLDPSHLTFSKTELGQVLQRLSNCFRLRSCHVFYEADLLSAACHTMEQVEFQVSMFEDRADPEVILLEVQRRAGDSYVFHHVYVQAIKKAVQGEMVQEKSPDMDMDTGISLELLAKHACTDDDIVVAIELATSLVTADRSDACLLGLESLEMLTDTSKTGQSTARKVARALVMPEDDVSQKLSKAMKEHLLEDDVDANVNFRALTVWSNAWQVAAEDTLSPGLEAFCPVVCDESELMHCLMTRVEEGHKQPHHATLALLGLTALCRQMPQLRSSVSWGAVERCKIVGAAQNFALEQASRKFLEAR